jgi:hypothetical protein
MWRGRFTWIQGLPDRSGYTKWPCLERVPRHKKMNFISILKYQLSYKYRVYLSGDALLHELESGAYLEASNLRFELNSSHQGK